MGKRYSTLATCREILITKHRGVSQLDSSSNMEYIFMN